MTAEPSEEARWRVLGPQLIGHTSFNWLLVSATFVAVVTLGESVGSALMAFAFFGETLAPLHAGGFGLNSRPR